MAGGRRFAGGRLVLASHNAGKLRELEALLGPYGVEMVSAGDLGLPEPEETGDTFIANAVLKAEAASGRSGLPALADDSGIAVDGLDGAPGIYSARWGGPERDFGLAMARVARELTERHGLDPIKPTPTPTLPRPAGEGATGRTPSPAGRGRVGVGVGTATNPAWRAHFVSALALSWPDGHVETVQGIVHGTVVWPMRGLTGFGYDPIFRPDGSDITFGEMAPEQKMRIDHRARAFRQLVERCFA